MIPNGTSFATRKRRQRPASIDPPASSVLAASCRGPTVLGVAGVAALGQLGPAERIGLSCLSGDHTVAKRISELPAAGGVADTDELEVNQSGVSRKTTRGQLIAGLAGAAHQHALAEITDAGGLAALDSVGTASDEPWQPMHRSRKRSPAPRTPGS